MMIEEIELDSAERKQTVIEKMCGTHHVGMEIVLGPKSLFKAQSLGVLASLGFLTVPWP